MKTLTSVLAEAYWLAPWCGTQLGSVPAGVLFHLEQIFSVFGLRLADGRSVVVKARPSDGRAASCVAAQAHLAGRGFPCAAPLTAATEVGSLSVHAEEFRPGGEMLVGADVAADYARVFVRLMSDLAAADLAPPRPSPWWVAWDHDGSRVWPAIADFDQRDQSVVPELFVEVAGRLRKRLLATDLPNVLGHADFEAQNLRWHGRTIHVVHDWDSLAWQPEAALAGAASGTFASGEGPPGLAEVADSHAFLETYQAGRGRAFTATELEVAWAASLWTAVHNARWEALFGRPPFAGDAVRDQAAERLRRANA